jgi:RNA polymerase sigma-70 factor (ECF subfamily)
MMAIHGHDAAFGSQRRGRSAPAETDSFESLWRAAQPRLRLIALAIVGNQTEAEDVLQDASITGLKKYQAGEFSAGTSFDGWMGQITRFTALNALRKRHGAPAALGDGVTRVSPRGSVPMGGVGGNDMADGALSQAMAELPETQRLCLVLRIVGGLPYTTIAYIAEIPEGTAMSHVHRGQRTLRNLLGHQPGHGGRDKQKGGS